MDELLKVAAEAGVEASAAEAALEEGAYATARDAVDRARDALAQLRERWSAMGPAERRVVGGSAAAVRERVDAVAARLPAVRTVTEAVPEADPEQELDPEAG